MGRHLSADRVEPNVVESTRIKYGAQLSKTRLACEARGSICAQVRGGAHLRKPGVLDERH